MVTPLDAALEYAAHGLAVLPVTPFTGLPPLKGWQNKGTTDPELIRTWWTGQYASCGVGILTGYPSGVWVFDVDTDRRRGKVGDESLAELEAIHGPLPDTHEVITGSGGRHLYFRMPADGSDVRNDQSAKAGVDLDVRGTGGFVVAPPTGHKLYEAAYELEAGCTPYAFADAPEWLYALVQPAPTTSAPSERPPLPPADTDRPGDLWAAQTTWATILLGDGWTHHHTDRDGTDHWTRPGKDAKEGTSATTGYGTHDILKVFTSSMAPALEPEGTYTKMGYLAATRHGGDLSATARALREAGWKAAPVDFAAFIGDGPATVPPAPASLSPESSPGEAGGGAGEWVLPPPLPDAPAPPPWPRDVLPAWMQDQVDNIADQIHCAPDLPGMFTLGALSVAGLGRLEVEVRAGHFEPCALYLVVPAPPSEGKSAALEMAFSPVYDHEESEIEAAEQAVAEAESERRMMEARLKTVEASAANTRDEEMIAEAAALRLDLAQLQPPPEGRLTTGDITPERLAVLLARNKERVGIVSDESGVLAVDRYGDKKRGSNLDLYLQAWSGRKVTVDRVTAPSVRLRRPLLSIVVGAQPEAWATALADPEFRSRGLGARFMSATPAPRGHTRNVDLDRDEWRPEVDEEYRRRMLNLAEMWARLEHRTVVRLSREAKRAWTTWRQPLQGQMVPGGDLYSEASWVSKMGDSVLRVAALLHAADGAPLDDEVPASTMDRACRLGDYWIAHRLHDTTDEYDQARGLLASLAALATKEGDATIVKRTALQRAPKALRKTEAIAAPLVLLAQHGWVRLVGSMVTGVPGVPADPAALVRAMTAVELHPSCLGGGQPWRGDTVQQGQQTAPSVVDDHAPSTSVAPVAPLPYSVVEPPPLPSETGTETDPGIRGNRGNGPDDETDDLGPMSLLIPAPRS